jgi:hypothetical protein
MTFALILILVLVLIPIKYFVLGVINKKYKLLTFNKPDLAIKFESFFYLIPYNRGCKHNKKYIFLVNLYKTFTNLCKKTKLFTLIFLTKFYNWNIF